MSRVFNKITINVLQQVSQKPNITIKSLYKQYPEIPYKDFYNLIYRVIQQGFINKSEDVGEIALTATNDGLALLSRFYPTRDGVWKMVIFDIPEKQKFIRNVLRARLKLLNFKKWQNSIWISPYKLEENIEQELKELAKKFFVRLIKTTDINYTDDLEKLFK